MASSGYTHHTMIFTTASIKSVLILDLRIKGRYYPWILLGPLNVLTSMVDKNLISMKIVATIVLLILAVFPVQAQRFGGSVAATSDHVFVGETNNSSTPGEVYVYSRANGWAETARLTVSDEVDRFGRSMVAHSMFSPDYRDFDDEEELLLIGASHANSGKGKVYVYTKDDAGEWVNTSVLTGPDEEEGDNFGTRMALNGTTALIAAPGDNDGAGAVYVYDHDGHGGLTLAATLTEGGSEGFGQVLGLGKDVVLVGAPQYDDNRGAVYVFQRDGDGYKRTDFLEAEGGESGDSFGFSIAVEAYFGFVFVGMPMASEREGAVLEFKRNEEGKYVQTSKLLAIEPQAGAQFGFSLLFSETPGDSWRDGMLWVGAPFEERRSGVVYRFGYFYGDGSPSVMTGAERQSSTFVKEMRGPTFGSTFAVGYRPYETNKDDATLYEPSVAVVGATGVDSREGAAIIMTSDQGRWMEETMVINDMKGDVISGTEIQCAAGEAHGWPCDKIDLAAFMPTHEIGGSRGTMANDIWGWTDPETGHEYALVGRSDGTAFVDITVPKNPVYVGNLPMTEGSRPNVWRDIKVYKDHAYVVADGAGEHGMQVFDLTQLRSAENTPVTFTETLLYDNIHSAHNIVINETTGFAYAVGSSGGGETCGGGLHMIDIRNPAEPEFAGCFADTSTGRRGTGYSHDAQCVIYHGPDTEHQGQEICLGSNETALSIADVTDKDDPKILSMAVYPNVAYAHQGWLSEDHTYFYMNDEGDEPQQLVEGTRTLIWDVTDLDDPVLVHEYIAETTSTDHNLYIRDNIMYQANYSSGLRILDITTPDDPVEIGFFDTTPTDGGGGGAWSIYPYFKSGVLIVTSMGEGLFVLKQQPVDI